MEVAESLATLGGSPLSLLMAIYSAFLGVPCYQVSISFPGAAYQQQQIGEVTIYSAFQSFQKHYFGYRTYLLRVYILQFLIVKSAYSSLSLYCSASLLFVDSFFWAGYLSITKHYSDTKLPMFRIFILHRKFAGHFVLNLYHCEYYRSPSLPSVPLSTKFLLHTRA